MLILLDFRLGIEPVSTRALCAAYEFFTIQKHHDTFNNWWIDWHFGTAQYMCLRLSECLNPIFYNIGSK